MTLMIGKSACEQKIGFGECHSQSGFTDKIKWQLALEKAFLDQQNDFASTVDVKETTNKDGKETNSQEITDKNNIETLGLQDQTNTRTYQIVNETNMFKVSTKQIQAIPQENYRMESIQNMGIVTVGKNKSAVNATRVNTSQHTVSTQMNLGCQSTLEQECIHLLKTDDGVQLYVRSGELDCSAVLRISQDIRRMLDAKGLPLVRVSLNGERIWEVESESFDDCYMPSCFESRINKIY